MYMVVVGQVLKQKNTMVDVESKKQKHVVRCALGVLYTPPVNWGRPVDRCFLTDFTTHVGGGLHVDLRGGGLYGRGGNNGGDLHVCNTSKTIKNENGRGGGGSTEGGTDRITMNINKSEVLRGVKNLLLFSAQPDV